MRLSHKDFILLIGILVAAVIVLTTWMYRDHQPKTGIVQPQVKKETLHSATSMVIDKLIKKIPSPDSCVR